MKDVESLAIFDYTAKAIQHLLVEESLVDSKQLRLIALKGDFSYWLSWYVTNTTEANSGLKM